MTFYTITSTWFGTLILSGVPPQSDLRLEPGENMGVEGSLWESFLSHPAIVYFLAAGIITATEEVSIDTPPE